MKIILLSVFIISLGASAQALSCMEIEFPENKEGFSIFKAQTVKDYDDKVEVQITECIKGDCAEGLTTIQKSGWERPRPETKTGETWEWGVKPLKSPDGFNLNSYIVAECTSPAREFKK